MAKMHICAIAPETMTTLLHTHSDISEELPCAELGECLAEAVEKLWRSGTDPTKVTFTVKFS